MNKVKSCVLKLSLLLPMVSYSSLPFYLSLIFFPCLNTKFVSTTIYLNPALTLSPLFSHLCFFNSKSVSSLSTVCWPDAEWQDFWRRRRQEKLLGGGGATGRSNSGSITRLSPRFNHSTQSGWRCRCRS